MSNNSDASPVYIRSSENIWIPALQLKTHNGKATVSVPKYASGEKDMMHCAKASKHFKYHNNTHIDLSKYPGQVLPMQNCDSNGNLEEYPDMVDLPFMHEAAILYNLKLRHVRERPYTRTGDIVIAVNPYKWYHKLYTEDKRNYYSNRLIWDRTSEDPRTGIQPHVYEVSSLSYKGLHIDQTDQSILVSGESGAGKTETVKICLAHLAGVQRGPSAFGDFDDTMETDPVVKRVVQSNPLLEAFGNAKTRRNDNSSRFGKYLQLQFADSKLRGSKCDVYLLEKNRVIGHDSQERTFHIFYQLLASKKRVQFWSGLEGASNDTFKYVGHSDTDSIEGMHDSDRFEETLDALAIVGVKGESLQNLMRAICIVLQLGNVQFIDLNGDFDRSAIASTEDLESLSALMGVDSAALKLSFTERTFSANKEIHKVPLNPDAAKDSCDALAKELYQKVFLWLVGNINKSTCIDKNESGAKSNNSIGLLDIFGFEMFPQNRFEQLCINYANEKLQQKFNEDVFENVKAEYRAEGVSLAEVHYEDNTDVLDLIEGRTGLLNLLNEECIRPKGNDIDFVYKALRINSASTCLKVNKTDRLSFSISHYAGEVMYDAELFVSKNIDTLPEDLQKCTEACGNAVINTARSEPQSKANKLSRFKGTESTITASTVWTKYKTQLSTLMANLRKTKSRYIRCIKPNTKKEPGLMEHSTTVEQLRCAGVVAGITIARSAFPNRLPNSVVLARYVNLWDIKKNPSRKTADMSITEKRQHDCTALMNGALKTMETSDENGKGVQAFVVGKTKTFFRSGALELLESGRMTGLDSQAVVIQKAARGWLSRSSRRHERRQRKMEDAAREEARQAHAEHLAFLEKQRIEERMLRQAELQKMTDMVSILENETIEKGQNKKLWQLNEANRKAQQEVRVMQIEFEKQEAAKLSERQIEKAEQEKKLKQHTKLVSSLKKGNCRARKEHQKVQLERDMLSDNNRKLEESNNKIIKSYEKEEMWNKKTKADREMTKQEIVEEKQDNYTFNDNVSREQDSYMNEAKARLQLQKALYNIMTSVQEQINDRSTVESIVEIALKAEAVSKSVMAALDKATLEPDLTSSECSETEAGSSYSDWSVGDSAPQIEESTLI